ncbi:MAG: hypothetical protein ABS46_10650 [Cytophagaceae bacterium SCN 52-12]|nr:MAG: hypothetical protein ABS46_10650 [Cytophagaceae bacterium SCN 52-12]
MFIKAAICISPQETFPLIAPAAAWGTNGLKEHEGDKYFAAEPSYEGLIQAGVLRRMGKAVRMGVGAGVRILKEAPAVDGIIIGTANGGLEDCIKFLNQIVDYDEGTLTPTNFVQSTPNAIAGQLALIHRNTGYNITHVHGGLSFENALVDASLLFEQEQVETLLVGGIEEISEYNHNIDRISGVFKKEPGSSASLLASTSAGTVNGEGAVMFLLERKAAQRRQVRIREVTTLSFASPAQVEERLSELLDRHDLEAASIDALMLGYNGDVRSAGWYDRIRGCFGGATPVFSFKNACGEYPTASAFAVWLGHQLLTNQPVPATLRCSGKMPDKPANLLIYNHYREEEHSFILLDHSHRPPLLTR